MSSPGYNLLETVVSLDREGACLGDGLRLDLVETGREERSSVFSTCSGYHVRYFMHPVCPHNSSEIDGASWGFVFFLPFYGYQTGERFTLSHVE